MANANSEKSSSDSASLRRMTTAAARATFLAALECPSEPSNDECMDGFQQLPSELLPEILRHLKWRSGELFRTCLVCKRWDQVSRPVSSGTIMVEVLC